MLRRLVGSEMCIRDRYSCTERTLEDNLTWCSIVFCAGFVCGNTVFAWFSLRILRYCQMTWPVVADSGAHCQWKTNRKIRRWWAWVRARYSKENKATFWRIQVSARWAFGDLPLSAYYIGRTFFAKKQVFEDPRKVKRPNKHTTTTAVYPSALVLQQWFYAHG